MELSWLLPLIIGLARGLRGVSHVWKKQENWNGFSWSKFIGSIVLLVIISLVAQFGYAAVGMTDMVGLMLTQIGFGWIGTDVIEDVITKE